MRRQYENSNRLFCILFEEHTTKLNNDIEAYNVNIQKHKETVDKHKQDVQRYESEKMEQTSSFKRKMNGLEKRESEFEVTFTILENKIKIQIMFFFRDLSNTRQS